VNVEERGHEGPNIIIKSDIGIVIVFALNLGLLNHYYDVRLNLILSLIDKDFLRRNLQSRNIF